MQSYHIPNGGQLKITCRLTLTGAVSENFCVQTCKLHYFCFTLPVKKATLKNGL